MVKILEVHLYEILITLEHKKRLRLSPGYINPRIFDDIHVFSALMMLIKVVHFHLDFIINFRV